MQKYTNDKEIRYFEENVQVGDWIDLSEYRLMTDDEVDQHENPEKYLSDEEKILIKRQQLLKLSKRQFSLYLYDNDLYDQVMSAINSNPRFKIEFDTVADIERLSPIVSAMTTLLGWTDEQVDEMWIEALKL
ncbi:hypothetical protein [Acinetobacter johnsonii]|jgi:CMP-N-acetylneuraminic acid synthetase|uniref:hypothetical protein n=1 Tax=Acinetobacter johnsonii TaxID=40214 RepID=UPI00103A7804|nr:hypothetical protein [Acinetobacter johnsonii]QBK70664.1 hypothetical protein E0Z08_14565 [Acinetobacter johnsonii]